MGRTDKVWNICRNVAEFVIVLLSLSSFITR